MGEMHSTCGAAGHMLGRQSCEFYEPWQQHSLLEGSCAGAALRPQWSLQSRGVEVLQVNVIGDLPLACWPPVSRRIFCRRLLVWRSFLIPACSWLQGGLVIVEAFFGRLEAMPPVCSPPAPGSTAADGATATTAAAADSAAAQSDADSVADAGSPCGGGRRHAHGLDSDADEGNDASDSGSESSSAAAAAAEAERQLAAAGELPPQWLDVTVAVRCTMLQHWLSQRPQRCLLISITCASGRLRCGWRRVHTPPMHIDRFSWVTREGSNLLSEADRIMTRACVTTSIGNRCVTV